MKLSCPKCGKLWEEIEAQNQVCNDCGTSGAYHHHDFDKQELQKHYAKDPKYADELAANKRGEKFTICPKCGIAWIEDEIEFQVCDNCGYENRREGIKQQLRSMWKSFKWTLSVAGAMLFASVVIYSSRSLASKSLGPGASNVEIRSFSWFIILIIFFIIAGIAFLLNRLNRKK